MNIRRFFLTSALAGIALTGSSRAQALQTVYTLTNDATTNAVAVHVSWFGHFFSIGHVPTGGKGTGSGLGSQGALALSNDGRHLVAVNPGSDSVATFDIHAGLFMRRTDVASTGKMPTSVTMHGDLVYVLGAGSDDLSGFRLHRGRLQALGTFPLSATGAAGAQVSFVADGRFVVVTERATNRIVVYPVQRDGKLGTAKVHPSSAPTPFGFIERADGTLAVSEAVGGQQTASALSTYSLGRDGSLTPITKAAATNQTAACWVAVPRNGRFVYTTNTGSGTVTGFSFVRDGSIKLLDATGVSANLGAAARPIDFDFGRAGRMLFVLDSGNDRIVSLYRGPDGRLWGPIDGVRTPDGAAGIVAR
ncbi:MAG: beta-propeller fold lactonase family protein [Planctomycetes bacterium]|nr:beta-propeller fold lactonase family protein [Planctomycetota bacterium]